MKERQPKTGLIVINSEAKVAVWIAAYCCLVQDGSWEEEGQPQVSRGRNARPLIATPSLLSLPSTMRLLGISALRETFAFPEARSLDHLSLRRY